mmetsp:Transcript_12865/g.29608  ORF Transcript_12865/g.29608 Transcript_12865/m.29608 type:complete len:186 (-) Transcript_12865:211-768(-)
MQMPISSNLHEDPQPHSSLPPDSSPTAHQHTIALHDQCIKLPPAQPRQIPHDTSSSDEDSPMSDVSDSDDAGCSAQLRKPALSGRGRRLHHRLARTRLSGTLSPKRTIAKPRFSTARLTRRPSSSSESESESSESESDEDETMQAASRPVAGACFMPLGMMSLMCKSGSKRHFEVVRRVSMRKQG